MREDHKIRIETRRRLWLEQNKVCVYCLEKIPIEKASLDHIIPVDCLEESLGEANLAVCCKKCNYNKGNHMIFTNLMDRTIYPMVDIPYFFRYNYITKTKKIK